MSAQMKVFPVMSPNVQSLFFVKINFELVLHIVIEEKEIFHWENV